MADTQEIFETFLASELHPANAIEALCSRHPKRAAHLRRLWRGYVEMAQLLDHVGRDVRAFDGDDFGAGNPRYDVRSEIARGGMGRVLEVWDCELRRTLAMKVLHGRPRGDAAMQAHWYRQRSRLLNEAQILGQLEHPGIVPIHEVGYDEQDRPYFTMLRVRGRALDEIFDDVHSGRANWTMARAVGVLQRMCEAIAHAHEKHVIHRDLKPANVMVGQFGEVFVMDWGLAKARGGSEDVADIRLRTTALAEVHHASSAESTVPGSVQTNRREERDSGDSSPLMTMDGDVLGTPSYMAPEQADGRIDEVDERSDTYSVGAMLYHLLAGQAPYVAVEQPSTAREVLRAVRGGEPEALARLAPQAAPELVAVCSKAMTREPAGRYSSMRELAEELAAHLEGRVVQAHRRGPVIELRKWVGRNKGAAAAVLLGILGLGSVAIVQTVLKGEIQQRARELRQRVYFNDVSHAQTAYVRGDTEAMKEALARCPPELRRWEWHCLAAVADTSELTLPFGAPIALSPDQRTLASMTRYGTLRLLDASTLHVRAQVVLDDGLYTHPVFSPDNRRVYCGGPNGHCYVIDVGAAKLLRSVDCRVGGHTAISVSASPDGRYLALSRDSGALDLWSAKTFEPVARLDQGIRKFSMSVWSDDGTRLFAACCDRETDHDRASSVRIYDVAAKKRLHVLQGHANWVHYVLPSPDGRQLASSTTGRSLIWDLTSNPIALREFADGVEREWPTWTRDGRQLLLRSGAHVEVRNAQSLMLEQVLVGHTSLPGVPVSLPGERVISHDNHTTKLWRLDRRKRIREAAIDHKPGVRTFAALAPAGDLLALSVGYGHIELWDVPGRRLLRVTQIPSQRTVFCFAPDAQRLFCLDYSGQLQTWDLQSEQCAASTQAHAARTEGWISLHPAGEYLATTAGDGKLALWDPATLRELWSAQVGWSNWPPGGISCAFSHQGDQVAVGAGDGRVRIFATRSGQVIRELHAPAGDLTCRFPSFSPDDRRVVAEVLSRPRSVVVWDVATGDIVWSAPAGHDAGHPKFVADGTRILSLSDESALVVRDAATGARIVVLENAVAVRPRAFAHSQDGANAVAVTHAGTMRFWDVPQR